MSEAAPGSQALKVGALEREQPLTALLELTYRCNWRCVFCYNPRHADLRGLSGAEWVGVLADLRELGTLTVTLTGGEPLLHPDFFAVAEAARERGFALRVFTNGSLVTEEVATRIAALYPLAVEMSLHGATPDVHDRATGRAGSFATLLGGLSALRSAGARVALKTPLTSLNEAQLEEMIALADERGVPLQVDPALTPRDDGDRGPLAFSASREAVGRLMRIPRAAASLGEERRIAGGVNCGLGRITLAVDPEGNVFPCSQWRQTSLGNVRQTPLRVLWRESGARRDAAAVARAANDRLVERGGAMASFPFCPAVAFQTTGDPLVPDPETLERAALALEVRGARP